MASPVILSDINDIDDLEFERRTLAAIRHELGLSGLARFLMTYRSGTGDYTRDRHQWLAGITIEDIEMQLLSAPSQPPAAAPAE